MLRREMLAAALTVRPNSPNPIVTNGLVLNLDGTSKGDNGEVGWLDSVGGLFFKYFGCSPTLNGVRFSGGDYAFASTDKKFFADGTFEVCFQNDVASPESILFMQPQNTIVQNHQWSVGPLRNVFAVCSDKLLTKAPAFNFLPEAGKNYTASFTRDMAYVNLDPVDGSSQKGHWHGHSLAGISVGGTSEDPSHGFCGTIYSIRIYDRVLSVNEVLQNQRHDVALYFGGKF